MPLKGVLHALAATIAIAVFFQLAPSIRSGQLGPFTALVVIALVLIGAYALIVAALGLFGKVSPFQWPSIARQLFRGHDGR